MTDYAVLSEAVLEQVVRGPLARRQDVAQQAM